MVIECRGHSADFCIVFQIQLPFGAVKFPAGPGAIQSVLEDGKLIGVVAHIVDQSRQQYRVNLCSAHAHGSCDASPSFITRHSGHQVLAFIDRLRQTVELRTVSEEIGAHCDDYIDWMIVLRARLQEQVNESDRGFTDAVLLFPIRGPQLLISEQLLELIRHDQ